MWFWLSTVPVSHPAARAGAARGLCCLGWWGPEDGALQILCVLAGQEEEEEEGGDVDLSAGRFVRYQFTPAFLRLRTVGAT